MSMGGMEAASRATPFREGETERVFQSQMFCSALIHLTSSQNAALVAASDENPAMVASVPTAARVSAGSQLSDSVAWGTSDTSRVQPAMKRQRV